MGPGSCSPGFISTTIALQHARSGSGLLYWVHEGSCVIPYPPRPSGYMVSGVAVR